MLAHPLHQLPPLGPVDPAQPQLFTGTAEPRTEETGASGIGYRGRGDDDGHQEPQRVDENVSFAAFDVFACIITALTSEVRGLDALASHAAGRGVLMTTGRLTDLGAQGVVEALPVATVTPVAEIPVDTGPLGILMREHPPLDAPLDDIKNGIDHRPHIQCAVASTRFGRRDQILEKIPFGISEVCGVWFRRHPHSLPN
jgi:hypothetical protein